MSLSNLHQWVPRKLHHHIFNVHILAHPRSCATTTTRELWPFGKGRPSSRSLKWARNCSTTAQNRDPEDARPRQAPPPRPPVIRDSAAVASTRGGEDDADWQTPRSQVDPIRKRYPVRPNTAAEAFQDVAWSSRHWRQSYPGVRTFFSKASSRNPASFLTRSKLPRWSPPRGPWNIWASIRNTEDAGVSCR